MKLSIIIPVLNEAEILGRTLASLKTYSAEIIVVDGGSRDNTTEVARQHTPNVLASRPGRGFQQHIGARQSRGDVLVFLHADTRLPPNCQDLIHIALADPKIVFGAFFLSIHPPKPVTDLIALMANMRSRLLKVPYGDQAIFVKRRAYFLAGGFKDWPIMEDVDLARQLNRIGGFKLARGYAQTSDRRWRKEHPVYTTIRNYSLILRYLLGASPYTLARHYPNLR
jgi:rSAM/selenodomain-associated transferase 2